MKGEVRTGQAQGVARPALRSKCLARKNNTHIPTDATTANTKISLIRVHYNPQSDIYNPKENKPQLLFEAYSIRQTQNEGSDYKSNPQVGNFICQQPLTHTQILPRRQAMRFLVFPYDSSTLMRSLKYSLRINVDLAGNIVIRERARRARLYTDGGYEEYEIRHIVDLCGSRYYIVGKLIEQRKSDYAEPIRNEFKEVVS